MAAPVMAHPMPQSFVSVRVEPKAWHLSLRLPGDRLSVALVQAGLLPDPGPGYVTLPKPTGAQVKAYVRDRVAGRSGDGRAWSERIVSIQAPQGTTDEWRVDLDLIPPTGASPRTLQLDYQVIVREIATHAAVVSMESDWYRGVQAQTPRIVGTLGAERYQLRIDRAQGAMFSGLGDVFMLGMHHIAEGSDHLLFLLALLLPAPLLAAGARWGAFGGTGHTFRSLLRIVTAFTAGHSLTLILGAFGGWTVPQKPVEVLIAASILVSAVHAWRPVFRGREPWIAAGFGLVHGLSFATVISAIGVDVWQKAAAILSFNLGIEAMQLAVVCLVVPWLILLARAGRYNTLRLCGAGLAAVASLAWMFERVTGQPNPASQAVTAGLDHAIWGVLVLAAVAVGVTLWQRTARAKAAPQAG